MNFVPYFDFPDQLAPRSLSKYRNLTNLRNRNEYIPDSPHSEVMKITARCRLCLHLPNPQSTFRSFDRIPSLDRDYSLSPQRSVSRLFLTITQTFRISNPNYNLFTKCTTDLALNVDFDSCSQCSDTDHASPPIRFKLLRKRPMLPPKLTLGLLSINLRSPWMTIAPPIHRDSQSLTNFILKLLTYFPSRQSLKNHNILTDILTGT